MSNPDSSKGLVSSGHRLVSEAAAQALEAGGNAFDAAVSAGFTSTVAEPLLTGLAGGGFLLARTATSEEILFDFFTDVPGLGARNGASETDTELDFFPIVLRFLDQPQTFHIGRGSVAVPGVLKGLLHVHARLGRLPLSDVLEPAVRLSREGVPLSPMQGYINQLLTEILTSTEEASRHFGRGDGTLFREGDLYRNPELAAFLSDLPRDPDGFYTGDLAREIAREMREGGGLLTAEDLAAYRVIEREPLSVSYRGRLLLTNPPPSLGGSLTGLLLSLLEAVDVAVDGWGSARHLTGLAGALVETHRLREAVSTIPIAGDREHDDARAAVRRFTSGTTHLNVADAHGNVASMSTSNGQGSACFAPGTGMMLNNMMGEDDLHPEGFHTSDAGTRIASMMTPSIVVRDGSVEAALGSGGSKRIRTAIPQVISNLVDFGLPVDEAVNRPRMHYDGEVVHLEPGFDEASVASLATKVKADVWRDQNLYFGGVHTVAPSSGQGAGDRRRSGHAMTV